LRRTRQGIASDSLTLPLRRAWASHGKTLLGLVEREEILATSHFLGHVHHGLAVFLVGLAQHAAKLV
jgi:hypothetical protein